MLAALNLVAPRKALNDCLLSQAKEAFQAFPFVRFWSSAVGNVTIDAFEEFELAAFAYDGVVGHVERP